MSILIFARYYKYWYNNYYSEIKTIINKTCIKENKDLATVWRYEDHTVCCMILIGFYVYIYIFIVIFIIYLYIYYYKINWNTVCEAIQNLPWRNIRFADNPVEVLNKHLSLLVGLYVLYQLRASVCATRINSGLMMNAGVLLASRRRLIYGGPVITLGLTGKSLSTASER